MIDLEFEYDVQVRSEETGLHRFLTLSDAMAYAKTDASAWKISFSIPSGERVRLIRSTDTGDNPDTWFYEPSF